MKKLIVTSLTILLSQPIFAADSVTYYSNGKAISKIEAVKLLLNDNNTVVERCYKVELTDSLSLKNKKQIKQQSVKDSDEVK